MTAPPKLSDRTFAADTPEDRRDDVLIALVEEGLTAAEISALTVGDVLLFDDSATVRLVVDGHKRFVRVTDADRLRDLRAYLERDVRLKPRAPLFPGRSPIRGMSVRRLYELLEKLREPNQGRERA